MSTSMMAVISLVYGVATIRLSGVTVLISSAVRAMGNQACSGWEAASSLIGAISRPSSWRRSSRDWPRWARRAVSSRAKVR